MFNTLKKINPFKKNNYKELYEKEVKRREELEQVHKYLCKQINSVMEESNNKYSAYKKPDIHI